MGPRRFLYPVDSLSDSLIEVASGKLFDTEIYELNVADLRKVTPENGWHFDWRKELNTPDRQAYKIVIKGTSVIQGLISLENRETFFFLPLIETAPHNLGQQKRYKNAPRSLIAFACKRSFEFGYGGEVAFRPKTKLIEHYVKELEAELL